MKQPKEIIHVGDLELRFLLDGDDTNNQMVLFESIFPGGAKVAVPAHYHKHTDEMIYGLEGVLTITLDGKKIEIGSGQSCFVRRGIVHHVANSTTETVKALGLMTPAVIGLSYFKEVSELLKAGTFPDLKKLRETMLRNDTVPVMVKDNVENFPAQLDN